MGRPGPKIKALRLSGSQALGSHFRIPENFKNRKI
ncbi:hypothetical protein CAEBREN_21537 [Caenorhabditis brenneri]|uniref:Uncharacterized protein n=1 Tax=Caenorhabditis brenneri TaxID=135651 RepID=G0M984_CAEBE|nr:hypothetical protein CAEBREN_21537 [Caenorhabditis brenneri]